jgi:hypothetical protein
LQKTLFRSVLTVLIKVPNATLESHAITQDGARYFGLMSLRSPYGDYTDTVGLRNSHDKSFPIGLAFGSRVWLANRFLVGESFLPFAAFSTERRARAFHLFFFVCCYARWSALAFAVHRRRARTRRCPL